jgi:Flp pilus assembly protein TadD
MKNQVTFFLGEAMACLRNKNLKAAELFLFKAATIDPKNVEILRLIGVLEAQCKNYDKALSSLKKALKISPNNALIISNIGNVYFEQRQFGKAKEFYERSIKIDQNYADAHSNLGNVLQELRYFNQAIFAYEVAISIDPSDARVYVNKGNALMELGHIEDAIQCYDCAINIQSNCHSAYWHMSLALLLNGNFRAGFQYYESRWADFDDFHFTGGTRNFTQPLWLGKESLVDKTILINCEQGLGDSLQFSRYVKLVSDLGAKVIFEVPKPLVNVFQALDGVAQLVIRGDELPKFDFYCPLLSLPLAFETDINSIPGSAAYLKSDPQKVSNWEIKLGKKTKPRIGIAWSSTSPYKADTKRSLLLSDFVKALPDEDYEYICLQKEIKECDKDFLKSFGKIQFYGNYLSDFSDTAALVDCVDLVISTCTSIPHLSAALGKETWIVLSYVPDWRWLLGREDSPWYPSVRLFRQEELDNWSGTLSRVKACLSL